MKPSDASVSGFAHYGLVQVWTNRFLLSIIVVSRLTRFTLRDWLWPDRGQAKIYFEKLVAYDRGHPYDRATLDDCDMPLRLKRRNDTWI